MRGEHIQAGRLTRWFRALYETVLLMEQTPYDDLADRVARLELELAGRTAAEVSATPGELESK